MKAALIYFVDTCDALKAKFAEADRTVEKPKAETEAK